MNAMERQQHRIAIYNEASARFNQNISILKRSEVTFAATSSKEEGLRIHHDIQRLIGAIEEDGVTICLGTADEQKAWANRRKQEQNKRLAVQEEVWRRHEEEGPKPIDDGRVEVLVP